MPRKEMIALLLAGGQGSRLGVLTQSVAKPAVLYGGKYRIIDFTLSNCINSGIDTVGVLTQYQPLKLNAHIGIGKPWDLDRMNGGISSLAPYTRGTSGEWYTGTADAVYQNIHYVDAMNPDYVIILSGDHIYKMDYAQMLAFHKDQKADATISVINVPLEEASRYGILNCDTDDRIVEFDEKPKQPKSTLASMGIYIFTWAALREYLVADHTNPDTEHDFGKNILPRMLDNGCRMMAYRFEGYWRDVGTIEAYWDSTMNLISRVPDFNLFDPNWKIYTPNPVYPAHYIGETGVVNKSIVAEGCIIHGTVRNSVIFPGVRIDRNVHVEDSIIMSDTIIGEGSVIRCTIIGENSVVGNGVETGLGAYAPSQYNTKVYDSRITVIGSNTVVPNGLRMGQNVVIDNGLFPGDYDSLEIPSGGFVMKGGESA